MKSLMLGSRMNMGQSGRFGLAPCLTKCPSLTGHLIIRKSAKSTASILTGRADQLAHGGLFAPGASGVCRGLRFD